MEQSDLLRYLVTVLERSGLRYFITGSTVTIFFGEPRFTNDIDVVVDLPAGQIETFCRQFPEDEFDVSVGAARQAVAMKGQFNIIHPISGLKIDVMIPEDSAFNSSRFRRATPVRPGEDYEAVFASMEDAILKKLEYYQLGGSTKHLRDIAGLIAVSGDQLDRAYLATWVGRLGLDDAWQAAMAQVGGRDGW